MLVVVRGGGLGLKDLVKEPKAILLKGTDMGNVDKSRAHGLFQGTMRPL